jgi:hypothetical protein
MTPATIVAQQPCRPGLDLAQKAGPGPPQKKKRGYGLLGRQSAQPDQAGVDLVD